MTMIFKIGIESDVNIGHINIGDINSVSSETYEVIEGYGGKILTKGEIIALDKFLKDLREFSAYDKITFFIMPILAPRVEIETPESDKIFPTDSKAFYDLITKENFKSKGFNGYIDNHGLKIYKNVGNVAGISFSGKDIQVTSDNFTFGAAQSWNQFSVGYLCQMDQFGASNKTIPLNFSKRFDYTDDEPIVTCMSRSKTEAHGVRNGELGSPGAIVEPYASNPYMLSNLTPNNLNQALSLVFICKDYMMTEEELISINKICFDFLKAIW